MSTPPAIRAYLEVHVRSGFTAAALRAGKSARAIPRTVRPVIGHLYGSAPRAIGRMTGAAGIALLPYEVDGRKWTTLSRGGWTLPDGPWRITRHDFPVVLDSTEIRRQTSRAGKDFLDPKRYASEVDDEAR